jgi:Large ribosomal RNA subunit accumulation protein YceD
MTEKSSFSSAEPKPFSYQIKVAEVAEGGLDVAIEADPASLAALAKMDGLSAIASLTAEFHVAATGQERFNVSGEMRARVTQICVVSLEPFESEIVEPIDVDFAPPEDVAKAEAASLAARDDADLHDERDPPDPIIDGKIDLGALAAEFLALGLDPYPRKPGVSFQSPVDPGDVDANPFSVLGRLKERN